MNPAYQTHPVATPRPTANPAGNPKAYLAALFSTLASCVLLTTGTTYLPLRAHFKAQQQQELQRSQDFNRLRNVLTQPFQLSRWMSRDTFLLAWLQGGKRTPAQPCGT